MSSIAFVNTVQWVLPSLNDRSFSEDEKSKPELFTMLSTGKEIATFFARRNPSSYFIIIGLESISIFL